MSAVMKSTTSFPTGSKLKMSPDTLALATETNQMEQRLKSLRETLSNERSERRRSSAGSLWRAGREGTVQGYATQVLEAKNARLKARAAQNGRYGGVTEQAGLEYAKLVSQNREHRKPGCSATTTTKAIERPVLTQSEPTELNATVDRVTTAANPTEDRSVMWRVPTAIQNQENDDVEPNPVEKGGLPDFSTGDGVLSTEHKIPKPPTHPPNPKTATTRQHPMRMAYFRKHHNVPSADTSSSLLEGSFDEDGGRQSFLEALNEWRNGGKQEEESVLPMNVREETGRGNCYKGRRDELGQEETKVIGTSQSSETETRMGDSRQASIQQTLEEITCMFQNKTPDGMSYLDRLLLNKLRREYGPIANSTLNVTNGIC